MPMPGTLSPAVSDLGLGAGADLQQQVKDETDEERKKRLMGQQTQPLSPGVQALGLAGGGS